MIVLSSIKLSLCFVEKTSYPHQSQYFNREFPTLGGGNSKDRLPEERVSHQPYGQPPRNMREYAFEFFVNGFS